MAGTFDDEKQAVVKPSGTYCLEVVLDSSAESNRYKKQTKLAGNLSYVHEYFQYVSGLDASKKFKTCILLDSSDDPAAAFNVYNNGGSIEMEFQYCHTNDTWEDGIMTPVVITAGNWYRIQYMYDLNNDEWEASVVAYDADPVMSSDSGSLTGDNRKPNQYGTGIYDCDQDSENNPTTYHDKVVWRIDEWEEEVSGIFIALFFHHYTKNIGA